jgi:ABC-type microcin C transport system duplicated ATPase subunit YejF
MRTLYEKYPRLNFPCGQRQRVVISGAPCVKSKCLVVAVMNPASARRFCIQAQVLVISQGLAEVEFQSHGVL